MQEIIQFQHEGRTFVCERRIIDGEERWAVCVTSGESFTFPAMPGTFDVPMSVRAWVLDWWRGQS